MIRLGDWNTLIIKRDTSVGLFLGLKNSDNDVLLPNKYVPEIYKIGEELNLFCYLDFEERPVLTNLKPYIIRDTFKLLKVVEVNNMGAFLDWGLEKHLLVPFREQRVRMKEGQWYVVFCYLDEQSFRLVASNKLDKFLDNQQLTVQVNEEVDLILTRQSDLGWDAIINNKHKGLIYANEVFKKLAVGDNLKGYIKYIRPDHKIDISLQAVGYESVEPAAQLIYSHLKQAGGFLNLHDKSAPEEIGAKLQMSKKIFKKSIGTLYKDKKIEIKPDGIYLI